MRPLREDALDLSGALVEQMFLEELCERAGRQLSDEPHQIRGEPQLIGGGPDRATVAGQRCGDERPGVQAAACHGLAQIRRTLSGAATIQVSAQVDQDRCEIGIGWSDSRSLERGPAKLEAVEQLDGIGQPRPVTHGTECVELRDDGAKKRYLETDGLGQLRPFVAHRFESG
jgi:hypothetical protein